MKPRSLWTNVSVRRLVAEEEEPDPVRAITQRARTVVLQAMDNGWDGPPFDPLKLADILDIELVPHADIPDAQTVPLGRARFRIEFNPNRPATRVRYSIAHELAHTLFRDCAEQVRYRTHHRATSRDEWQLEALCNIAAAELLMPYGSLHGVPVDNLGIEELLELRKRFQVSIEALLIRIAHLSSSPCAVFCASRGARSKAFRFDYIIRSSTWPERPMPLRVPPRSLLGECTAIGYTTVGNEHWEPYPSKLHVEAVGIPAYPGSQFPRVVGIVAPLGKGRMRSAIRFVRGSALEPRGREHKVVVHVVNDKTANWGGRGFAQAVGAAWPRVQADFRDWVGKHHSEFRLGAVRYCEAAPDITVASVVAQKGYGESAKARIRYGALGDGLAQVVARAAETAASLHMPRIGSGLSGGSWPVVEDMVRAACATAEISVTVYDLPDAKAPKPESQQRLPI